MKYYDFNINNTNDFTLSGKFAIGLKASKEDVERINQQIEKLQNKIITKDEISYVMNLFSTLNIFKIDSLLREEEVINADNSINPDKIINIDNISISGDENFIIKYEMILFSNQISINFPDEIKIFFDDMYNILISSPAWTGHVYPIDYIEINNLYVNAMNLVKKMGNDELYYDMYEAISLSASHIDNSPSLFLHYNSFYIKNLAKGIRFIINYVMEDVDRL